MNFIIIKMLMFTNKIEEFLKSDLESSPTERSIYRGLFAKQ